MQRDGEANNLTLTTGVKGICQHMSIAKNHLRLVHKSMRGETGGSYRLPPAWEEAVTGWLIWLRVSGRPQTTIRTRRGQVRVIAHRSATSRPADVDLALLVRLFSEHTWSNDYRKGVRAALVDFFDWCCREGHANHNPAAGLPKVAGNQPRPKPATDDVWIELIARAGPRELLMARLACEAGMRRAEVAVAHRDDLLEAVDGPALIVHGKGGKQRVVAITDELAAAIRRHRPEGGYLFPGQISGHISALHVGKLISALMPPGWSMHKLRHRFATRGYAGTGNLRAVQEALGHASVATTQRYTAIAARDLRAVAVAAAKTLELPDAAAVSRRDEAAELDRAANSARQRLANAARQAPRITSRPAHIKSVS